jgi:hypothetical protein
VALAILLALAGVWIIVRTLAGARGGLAASILGASSSSTAAGS